MDTKDKDLFAYRSCGGVFKVGSDEEDTTSALLEVDHQLMFITKKNIRKALMADDVDPNRTNHRIDHNIQHVLPYGSDSEFVGRTLQLSGVLFEEHALPKKINHNNGISISFSFLKEITSLDKLKNEYIEEQEKINSGISSKAENPQIPAFPNLEEKMKNFILNADRAKGCILDLVLLFYPEIKPRKWDKITWEEKLFEKFKEVSTENHNYSAFVDDFKQFTQTLREIRNCVEHPNDKDFTLSVENYQLTPQNKIKVPSIFFRGKKCNLEKKSIVDFMKLTNENLLTIFEILMAYLCNIHAQPFAGDKRIVVSVPSDKRKKNEKHVGFQYEILWTK